VVCSVRNRKVEKNIKHNGNLTLNDIYGIARTMRPRSLAKEFSGTVKEILGTCQSIGATVDGQAAAAIIQQIRDGTLETPKA
jgi:large subunit ribosomal protein L12e